MIQQWVGGSSPLTTTIAYDTTGQVLSVCDPAGNPTKYSYTDKFFTDDDNPPSGYSPTGDSGTGITTNAYLTTVTDSIGSRTAGYYYGSGKNAYTADYNGTASYAHFMDMLDRQTAVVSPSGWGLAAYNSPNEADNYSGVGDSAPSLACISCAHTQVLLDGLGRVTSQSLVNNPAGTASSTSTFDLMSRMNTISHPNFGPGDPNNVVETITYDGLSRQTSITHPDGQSASTAYGAKVVAFGGLSAQVQPNFGSWSISGFKQ